MRTAIFASGLAALALAAPVEKREAITDAQILNYALTLEHLEDTFYRQALEKFTEKDFVKAGVNPNFYYNLMEISKDEATHVSFLTSALQSVGAQAVAACTYDFGYTDVPGFLATAALLEGVGVSAYLGAAQNITVKAYLEAAGAILTVEARHSAYLRDNQIRRESPFPSPFDIPLDFDEVYSLAALFITGCPSGNGAKLPALKAFPFASVTSPAFANVGDKLAITVAKSVDAKAAYFVTVLGPVSAPISGSGTSYTVTVPTGVQSGQEYLVLTGSTDAPTDDNIVAIGVAQINDNVTNCTSTATKPHGYGWRLSSY